MARGSAITVMFVRTFDEGNVLGMKLTEHIADHI
jgi:hypothetical protein